MNYEIKYILGDTFFTWDDEKAETNWEKHGVTFEDAA
ncbi:MAG: BrnT family toxin [Synergistaceae bacterium]|nr:BrnT family toxin [Synergistaceae bacterium]MBQ3625172.1 BrnT family toxin [Synergistaceae bacterium]MBQ6740284.1 BrnT family toxin [Synergistaceae bacterium]MBQ7569402.1 BrnT family toxin [Synergistaceae bacterium]MBQ9581603.1 BrnT family toxin [Synergistaceae bacterium]